MLHLCLSKFTYRFQKSAVGCQYGSGHNKSQFRLSATIVWLRVWFSSGFVAIQASAAVITEFVTLTRRNRLTWPGNSGHICYV